MDQHPLENLAAKFQALKALTLSPEERRQYPRWVEFLALRKQGRFPLPPMFNNVSVDMLRSYWGEQIALASHVPPSLRQPTLEQERLRQCFMERYALACMVLRMPTMPLSVIEDEPLYPEFAADLAALKAYRKRHPLPRVNPTDEDHRLLQLFLSGNAGNGWEQ